ncbi:YccF domain-containing protein [Marinobacterium lutimaris]|uniref:YccF domain-containing protein n=1 Tax=Marinobacterium lutimaris TaxID=568106 RepID=UPI000CDEFF83|nr:YccF domain-containing protein [Marinobacterium lutimaris]
MRLIGNVIWFVFGGFFMGMAWFLIGLIAFVSIIGIPWGRACFNIGLFSFFPFGKEAVSREVSTGKSDIGTGSLGLIGNIIWLLFAGIWLALGHLVSALFFFITIIGIPFGLQHIKLVNIALMPIGKCIVDIR